MLKIIQSPVFARWFNKLRDRRAAVRIAGRLERLRSENFGDVKPVGEGVSELRIDHGPGYRVYLTKSGMTLVILLCGGDKSSQSGVIARAKKLAKEDQEEWAEWR
jgi:putative addiction module killer protein